MQGEVKDARFMGDVIEPRSANVEAAFALSPRQRSWGSARQGVYAATVPFPFAFDVEVWKPVNELRNHVHALRVRVARL